MAMFRSGNSIGPDGLFAIADSLVVNDTLWSLSALRGNQVC
jgi:hypothetical protein